MVASWASAIALTIERPRPSPFASAVRAAVESLERLEDPLELAGGDRRAGVGDGEDGSSVARLGCELDVTAGDVVADRVRDEVGDEPFDEARVAASSRAGSRWSSNGESVVVCGRRGGGGDGGEVDGLVARRGRAGCARG